MREVKTHLVSGQREPDDEHNLRLEVERNPARDSAKETAFVRYTHACAAARDYHRNREIIAAQPSVV